MADHIYNPRRLEQCALNLLAFFNNNKTPLINKASAAVALRKNKSLISLDHKKSTMQN